MERFLIGGAMILGALLWIAAGAAVWKLDSDNVPVMERFLRRRYLGSFVGAVALAWCVPYIQEVAWTWLVPYLWYLAIAVVIGCHLYLDNVLARGVAGLLIMGAYCVLDLSFDCRFPAGLLWAVTAWLWGIAGILIAAKPCWLRDWLRLTAKNARVKYIFTAWIVFNVAALAIMSWICLGGNYVK